MVRPDQQSALLNSLVSPLFVEKQIRLSQGEQTLKIKFIFESSPRNIGTLVGG